MSPNIRSSFWFIPAVMVVGAMVLAFAAVALDKTLTNWLTLNWNWTFTGGAEGASALLGVIAGSMITIAGVVFSMTLVALSLTSSQLGPRLLRNFMRDTTNQTVLGTFVATFLYCLIVLGTIRRADEIAFVPHLSVNFGVLLAVVSVGLLIYFIHHVSVSIQTNEVVALVRTELIEGIERLFPENIGRGAAQIPTEPPDADFLATFAREARPIWICRGRLSPIRRWEGFDGVGHAGGCRISTGATTRPICRCHAPAGAGLARKQGDRSSGGTRQFRVCPG